MKNAGRLASLLMVWVFVGVANAATHTVNVRSFSFTPQDLTIQQGDTVKWVWIDGGHTSTSPGVWDSGVLSAAAEFSRTFTTAGLFNYVCTPHSSFMFGSVTVKADTTTALSSSQNPSGVGQSVTFTATVSASGGSGGTPTGTVTFLDDATALCTNVALSAGSATCMTSSLSEGTHPITAVYSGDSSFNGSTSPVLTQTVSPPPGIPPMFSATATSASDVSVTWGAVSGATSYEVVRSSMNMPYAPLPMTGATALTDMGLSASTTYLYRVRAIGPGGSSALSPIDPATTVIFTDAMLAGELVKVAHVGELRTAVNAMRAAAGLLPAMFTDHPLTAGTTIKAQHVTELRNALDAARSAIMLAAMMYTDSTITPGTTVVKAAHPLELRAGTQ